MTPQVALDPDGDGAVVWARYDGRSFVIQGAGYDGAGPVLDKLSVPATGVVGKRLTFSVAPRDVWSAVGSIHWIFGDGRPRKRQADLPRVHRPRPLQRAGHGHRPGGAGAYAAPHGDDLGRLTAWSRGGRNVRRPA